MYIQKDLLSDVGLLKVYNCVVVGRFGSYY